MQARFQGYRLEGLLKSNDRKLEQLSEEDYIYQQDLRDLLSGNPYKIARFNDDGIRYFVECEPVTAQEFFHYYEIYDTIKRCGWPNGNKGWLNEQEWVVDIFKAFDTGYESLKLLIEAKAYKTNGRSSTTEVHNQRTRNRGGN